jgi:hypothetical protein
MNVTCEDRERIFIDGTAEEWLALEAHGANCARCAEELRAWKVLSVAAAELRDYRDNPALWKRIEGSLIEQKEKQARRAGWWSSILAWPQAPKVWQLGLAGALVLALALSGGYLFVHRESPAPLAANGLLKDHTLADVERTEREYMKAIDKLASEAKPQMELNTSPLMSSYQEKLVVLDSAIDELRLQAGQNPSNAHLRYQLLAMYQEKEATLRDILETKR